MDVRDQLRRYLEQRRDMGETELLLDTMTVDDVMKAIGAINAGGSRSSGVEEPGSDWRAVLGDKLAPTQGLEAPADSTGLFDDDVMRLASLKAIEKSVAKCTRCRLYKTALNPVPGEGNPKAQLVCVGEAPGGREDETGRPFVGAAGNLLNKILAAVELRREDVFICNVLKHRPPGNRNPLPDEVAACSPYLVRQLELIKPKVIVAFGGFAAQTLLDTKTPIGKLRGLVHQYRGIPLVVTYHPAALLRNPAWKRPTWEDVKLARRILDSPSRA
ncbi:MAG: uracil-DNA glycosylase [Gemmatimonadota bacterium]|nr:uracil-DNA glycosylase [Gemmatimonadota bacterium]